MALLNIFKSVRFIGAVLFALYIAAVEAGVNLPELRLEDFDVAATAIVAILVSLFQSWFLNTATEDWSF